MLHAGSKKEGAAASGPDVAMFLAPGTAGAADGGSKGDKPKKKRKSDEGSGGEAVDGKTEKRKKN